MLVMTTAPRMQVIVPKFDCIDYGQVHYIQDVKSFEWGGCHIRVSRGIVEDLPTTFLEPENGFFWVGCVYGRNDDAHRFGFFCGAALEYLKGHAQQRPDIIHCHDWPTAPAIFGDTGGSKCAPRAVALTPVAAGPCRIGVRIGAACCLSALHVRAHGPRARRLCDVLSHRPAGQCSQFTS